MSTDTAPQLDRLRECLQIHLVRARDAKAHEDRMRADSICPKCPPGQHITLTCRNHPQLSWSTKNITCIGARSIFYNLMSYPNMGPECECPLSDLHHVHKEAS